MTISPLTSTVQDYLPSILSIGNRNPGLASGTGLSGLGLPSIGMPLDQGGMSPFAQMLSTLQQLRQTNPAAYQQLAQQISTNLGKAAQQAQSQGKTTAANQLDKLAADFSQASRTDQLPSIPDLSRAFGVHRHLRAEGDGDGSSTSTGAGSLSSQATSAFLASLTQSSALNPATIIMDTISGAGGSGSIY
jgi:hypothetical protein